MTLAERLNALARRPNETVIPIKGTGQDRMESLSTKTALVYDNGMFTEIAVTLSKSFGRVLYYVPWTSSLPKSNELLIGDGIKGVERIESPWGVFDDIDIWIFTDVYEADLQQWLHDQGKRVWGCRHGAELELDRPFSKEKSRKLGIDIGPYKVVTGLDALREHLKKNKNQWVKISETRGDMETFGAKTYEHVEPRLAELEHSLGPLGKVMEFTVEQEIPDAVEAGYDGYSIDGKYPKTAMTGVEVKDEAYIAKVVRWSDLPQTVRDVNEKLAPALRRYNYRGFISTEVRCTDDGAYLIDPCCRAGSPPSELYQMMMTNIAEVIWHGAEGIIIEPEFEGKWGAEVILVSDWSSDNWMHLKFPRAVRENIKLRNFCVIDGEYYIIPQTSKCSQIGAVVASGNTPDEAIAECKRICGLIEGYLLDKPVAALDIAKEQIEELLGPEKTLTKDQKEAERLHKQGKISDRQLAKIMED